MDVIETEQPTVHGCRVFHFVEGGGAIAAALQPDHIYFPRDFPNLQYRSGPLQRIEINKCP